MQPVTSLIIITQCLIVTSSARHKPELERRFNKEDPCYKDDGSPRRCIPDFINAAYKSEITASSTCGNPPVNFCSHSSNSGHQKQTFNSSTTSKYDDDDEDDDDRRNCVICDENHPHPASHLTDLNNPHNMTSSWRHRCSLQQDQYVTRWDSQHDVLGVSSAVGYWHNCHTYSQSSQEVRGMTQHWQTLRQRYLVRWQSC